MTKKELKRAFRELFTSASMLTGKKNAFLYLSNHFAELVQDETLSELEYWQCACIVANLKAAQEAKAITAAQIQLITFIGRVLASGLIDTLTKA